MTNNWAGNVRFQSQRYHLPGSLDQLQQALAGNEKVRVVGSGHSFNHIADSMGDLIDLSEMPRKLEIDSARKLAHVSGGWTYSELCPKLHSAGWALDNLASLPHINVAGACATATHGSGRHIGCLSTQVEEIELVTASGDLIKLTSTDNQFPAAVVGMGSLGVVTALTLRLRPTFSMVQHVYERIPLEEIVVELEKTMECSYSVSLFTAWEDQPFADIWVKRKISDDAPEVVEVESLFGVPATKHDRHPLVSASPDACTEQRTVGPWQLRLPHFRPEKVPASGDELQTEYFLPWKHAQAAIAAVSAIGMNIKSALLLSEIRAVASDKLWLSPFHGRDSLCIHFSWRNDWPAVQAVLPLIEDVLDSFDVRPHWGKIFSLSRDLLERVYGASFQRFIDVAVDLDPKGRFRNPFVDRYVFGD